ncbi:TonB-dependent receptor [Aliifodinibius sp. S!AR15-10]|uniref:carboxypeptidase-like regulatory domain-containing protein n=1 Tax=Aliifodinibius sp. S!AR15-10 TaxID=2950437 RepID=UPI002860B7ED|nr:carboxypeptidase-like regulatory domain-containing protein [Aliifodinibius sp. S!AR15-10]MDR8392730.1 TonB-dependent receptor [Aliifodinibius sp. S!AR15-10]
MERITALLLALICLNLTAFAQQNPRFSISGSVSTTDGDPVVNANVVLQNTTFGASTSRDGLFEITSIPEGDYTLRISAIGYKPFSQDIHVDEDVELNVTIGQQVEAMGAVMVSGAEIENYKVKGVSPSLRVNEGLISIPQNIQVITKDLLSDQQAVDMLESVSRNVSGAQMIEHWGNFARINMRGFRIPAFRNGMNVQSSWGPLTEDMVMVERIEFVKGPSAFMLSSGEPGGLYNVVTKKPTGQSGGNVGLMAGNSQGHR